MIIHDRIRVNLIYDVAARGEQESKLDAVQEALDEIRANLDAPENLSATAKHIRDTILANGVPLTAGSLADLRENIHTQLGIKDRFREGIIRSGRYLQAFQQVFEKEGVPAEVALLPLVESAFENRALSSAGAAGLWQFTRGTGRLYLNVWTRLKPLELQLACFETITMPWDRGLSRSLLTITGVGECCERRAK